ncbi:hypothetical protein P4O66_018903 [Electrophorus voltai]|uniref:Uncharacterized protein n=1 Tax=Electrophorus voltai TaxID=2609070 RepID=A0AAD8YRH5_9TELE|nr:hypothetical protein P4O66_018903 [Electrophorus voltai]
MEAAVRITPPACDNVLSVYAADVRKNLLGVRAFRVVHTRSGPTCKLTSLGTASTIPWLLSCFNTTANIPVMKKSSGTCLSDYCHIALAKIVMKHFVQLVMAHMKDFTPPTLEPHRYALHACEHRTPRDRVPSHPVHPQLKQVIKFADDTTDVELVTCDEETEDRDSDRSGARGGLGRPSPGRSAAETTDGKTGRGGTRPRKRERGGVTGERELRIAVGGGAEESSSSL